MRLPSTLKTLLCLSIITACDGGPEDVGNEERQFLFDMDVEDVLTLHDEFAPEMDEDEFIDAFTSPLHCESFGHICEEMGEEGALEFIRQTSELGLSGASPEEMNDFADALSREIVANARLDDEEVDFEDDGVDGDMHSLRGFGKTYKHFQYFGGIRNKLTYGRTNPLTSNAYGWGKLIQQNQGFLGTWSKINDPHKLYLKLRSVHHHQNWGVGGSSHYDSAERESSKYEGTYNTAPTDGQIYFKQYYDTPLGGWGSKRGGPVEVHDYIYTHACSRGWSGPNTSSPLLCWTDSSSHF